MTDKIKIGKAKSCSGTSLRGYVTATPRQIVEKLGNPTGVTELYGELGPEWCLEKKDGKPTIFTIYSGPEGLETEKPVEWHIGGYDQRVLDVVKELFPKAKIKK